MSRHHILYTLFFSFFALAALGQDHQTNKKVLSRHLREVYNVMKSDWKIKDGPCTVMNDVDVAVAKGQYASGKKVGIWNYYDNNGQLVQQYDFSHDSLLLQNGDAVSIVHMEFLIPQGVEDSSTLRAPYKIGGPEYGFYLLFDDRDIPQEVKSNADKAEMTYILTIDERGKLESYMIVFAGESINDITIRRTAKGLPAEALEYASARIGGQPVRSKISYRIPLSMNHLAIPGTNNIATQHPTN